MKNYLAIVLLVVGVFGMANVALGAASPIPPDYLIDGFANENMTLGLRGTAGVGTAPFIYAYEKYQQLNLTYVQPDGYSDVAWWEGLSFSWSMVDVSAYNYVRLDVQGMEGGEDATFEFHYRDLSNNSQKPYVRLSDYGTVATEMQTINIPIEDFESFIKSRATAVALGFRYLTEGVDSVIIDNIGLSIYPSSFLFTHDADALTPSSAAFIFKPHFPDGEGPCSDVRLVYSVNEGSVVTSVMTAVGTVWSNEVTGLSHGDEMAYHFLYDYPPGSETPEYSYTHNSVIDHENPTMPGNLQGIAVSPSQIDLTWLASTDNIGVAGYYIYRNNVEIGMSVGTNYSALGLTPGTTYSFYVRSFDAAGNLSDTPASINVSTPVDSVSPSVPGSLAAVVTGPTTVELSWEASTDNVGVEGYQLYRDGIYYASTASTNYSAGGTPGTTHVFRVSAYDRTMNLSDLSSPVEADMPTDEFPPSAPLNLTGAPAGPRLIALSWEASSDNGLVVGYEIFRDGVRTDTTPATNFVAYGQPDTEYAFMVRAIDSVGNMSDFSSGVVVTTLIDDVSQLGSYAAEVPDGFASPTETIYITTNMAAPFPSGDWWTSLMMVRCSGMMAARPMLYYAKGWTLEFAYPAVHGSGNSVSAYFAEELEIGAMGGSFPEKPNGSARVDGYGDYSVRTRIGNDDSYISATLVHGSPYTFFRFTDCEPLIHCPAGYTVITNDNAVSYLVIQPTLVQQNHYVIFAPAGTTWEQTSSSLITPDLPDGTDYLSVAVLTRHGGSCDYTELNTLRQHAYAFVTNTVVEFSYERSNAMIRTTFTAQTETMQDGHTQTLSGLLPHHWKHSDVSVVSGMEYGTLLGALKVAETNTFTTQHRFGGIVPQFPEPSDPTWSRQSFEQLASDISGVNEQQTDSYWHGKDLERLARVIPALDASGLTVDRDRLIRYLRGSLTNMFSYTEDEENQFFAYNEVWGALHGYNESYGAVSDLTDNHFHYGMFVYAAAILGIYDPYFAEVYSDVVTKVIRQYNNPSRDTSGSEPMPWLRCFDPWEGHCWSTGLGGSRRVGLPDEVLYTNEKSLAGNDGPDQESTSESMNAWAAMFLWGLVSGEDEFVDMGAAGYAIEASAIREYWYDADESNLPSGYVPTMVCRVFGSHLDAYTWFSQSMDMVWGIEYILTGPHMTYQGYFKSYREQDYAYFDAAFGAENVANGWKDIHWMYRCFFEPEQVLSEYRGDVYTDNGNTKANLYYWIHVMNSLGEVDTDVYSDHPSLVAMKSGGVTNYIAFNYTGGPVTARLFRASDDALIGQVVLRNSRTTAVATDGDDDGDYLSNGEEISLGTDLFVADTDDDRMSDWQEVFAGSDPLDNASVFGFGIQCATNAGNVSISWQGNAARQYRLRAYPSLTDCINDVDGTNILDEVTGTGLYEYEVDLPNWTNGYMKLQAY